MRINLYGGPGIGKSVKAAEIYLKGGIELVQEFVKPRAFRQELTLGWDCVHAFSCQLKRELELLDYTDIVTDSPLLLQVVYAKKNGCLVWEQLRDVALKFEEDFNSVNYVLQRCFPYKHAGRIESEFDASAMDEMIEDCLTCWGVKYETLPCTGQ